MYIDVLFGRGAAFWTRHPPPSPALAVRGRSGFLFCRIVVSRRTPIRETRQTQFATAPSIYPDVHGMFHVRGFDSGPMGLGRLGATTGAIK